MGKRKEASKLNAIEIFKDMISLKPKTSEGQIKKKAVNP